jgi:hypothetical protein
LSTTPSSAVAEGIVTPDAMEKTIARLAAAQAAAAAVKSPDGKVDKPSIKRAVDQMSAAAMATLREADIQADDALRAKIAAHVDAVISLATLSATVPSVNVGGALELSVALAKKFDVATEGEAQARSRRLNALLSTALL